MTAAPALVIRFEFEAAPRVYVEAFTDADETQLTDWFSEARPEYGELVARALELQERAA